jgi:high-affinity iron transporter
MLANLFIALREGLEASLVVGILIAYVVRINRRDAIAPIWTGVGLAVVVSAIVGVILAQISGLPDQVFELIAGILSIAACVLVTWMVFWMAKTARSLRGNLESGIDRTLKGGTIGLLVIAFVSVGREGVETVLFIWAAAQASGQSALPLLGAFIGLAIAAGLGFAIYRGMVRLNLSAFFTWSGSLLIILAGGVLAYGVHELQEAGYLPGDESKAFNVSAVIPGDSWYGALLRGTIGFRPEMSWLEVVIWALYVAIAMTLFLRISRRKAPRVVTSPIDIVTTEAK